MNDRLQQKRRRNSVVMRIEPLHFVVGWLASSQIMSASIQPQSSRPKDVPNATERRVNRLSVLSSFQPTRNLRAKQHNDDYPKVVLRLLNTKERVDLNA